MIWFSRLPAHSRGILYMLVSVTVFASMDMVAKLLGQRVDLSQVLWARYGGQLAVLLLIFAPRLRRALRTEHPWLQLARGLMQLAAAACFFKALQTVGLAEATAVADLAPVLITLGAALILGEKVGTRRMAGIAAALIGALIIIRPGSSVFQLASLWPLGSAVCLAGYALATRHIGLKESPLTGLLYSGLICTGILSLIVPFRWVAPDGPALALMLVIGCLGTIGQMMMIRAYAEAEASSIAPFSYAGLLAASGWGLLVFGAVPDRFTVLGALVIVAAGLYVWHRENMARETVPKGRDAT
ncbi:DMT family transporter [Celeribacter neptunius]|uniref:Permease of the drug/metabolite transporter (DMT) superfamily n=1 Tax=Celeribacter neptunius TaxID=588602 RepID=A0A1I3JUX1_9RHOB|nr:DMT family transporter [Celeribacter neptunius]SFI64069.1 Permease of the drug/metabolite transporter (DMT) superfamily [Celeribacter neptunius]